VTKENEYFGIVCNSVTPPTWYIHRKRNDSRLIWVHRNLVLSSSIGSYQCEGTNENGEIFMALSFVWPLSM